MRDEPLRQSLQPCPLPHERENPVQHESRRQSQCAHANSSQGQCSPPPRATHSQAEPQGCTDACHTFQEPQGIPEDAEGKQSATTLIHRHAARLLQPVHTAPAAPARACQPQAPRVQAQQSARRQSQCRPANRSPECAPAPASHRPTLRRARKSRAAPQAHPDARRTFHEPRGPPGTDKERARGVLHSFGCHVTAGTRHSWQPS